MKFLIQFLIIIAFSVVAVVISAMMIYMSMDYRRVLKRYAFPQGDIATAMSEAAEIRGASAREEVSHRIMKAI